MSQTTTPSTTTPADRISAAGGLAFTVLALASAAGRSLPGIDADAAEVRTYLAEHHDGLGVGIGLLALAVLALMPFLGFLYRRLAAAGARSAPDGLAVAGAGVVITAGLGVLLEAVLVHHVEALDDSSVLLLHRCWTLVALVGPSLFTIVLLIVAGVATLRTAAFPRWLGAVAITSGVLSGVTNVIELGTGRATPVVLGFGSFLLACLYFSGVSVSVLAGRSAAERPVAVAPAGQPA